MNYYEITFSPTGGTKKVANFLANGLFKETRNSASLVCDASQHALIMQEK